MQAAPSAPDGGRFSYPDEAAPSLTVIILTRNETLHLGRALASLRGLVRQVIIVDSGSTDGTRELARAWGALVIERAWVNYADQFQWALDHAGVTTEWVMRLDADETFGPDLTAELRRRLATAPSDVSSFSLDRRHYFMGRWIRHGGRYPLRLTRIWRSGMATIEQRWMDEHIVVHHGQTEHVAGEFSDINLNDLSFFTDKHNGYATREAIDALITRYALFDRPDQAADGEMGGQARRKRVGKVSFYNRLPLGLGPLGYFVFRYVFQLGFLDGKPGLIYHVLQGFWYRFLVDAKRYEFEREMAGCGDNEARIARLSQISGHDLRAFEAASRGTR